MIHLSANFPEQTPAPKFHLGDRVRFVPLPTEDYGIIVGLQFVPAAHLPGWGWRYTLWLDPQSPSRAWTDSDLAWEADLQLLTPDPAVPLSQEQAI
jgi:hypothetical protein